MSQDISQAEIEQMQEEAYSLIGAWMDRGVSPSESAMLLCAVVTRVLAETKRVSLTEFVEAVTAGWKNCNGKL